MKLFIGMPIGEDVPGQAFGNHIATFIEAKLLMQKLNETNGEKDNFYVMTPCGIHPHDAARYEIAEQAVKVGADRLFFMDDDTITPRGGIERLMAIMTDRKCAAVSGYYLRRGNPYTCVWSKNNGKNLQPVDTDSGVHEIDASGLGCCLIDLKWLERNVPRPWFKMDQDENKTLITDDLSLFAAIRKAGGVVLGDADTSCPHIGRPEFITRESALPLREVYSTLHKFGAIAELKPSVQEPPV